MEPDVPMTEEHIPLGILDDSGNYIVDELPAEPTDVPKGFVIKDEEEKDA